MKRIRDEYPEISLIGIAKVTEMLGVSYTLFKTLREDKSFPKPIIFGRRSMYRKTEIEDYIRALKDR